MCIIKIIVITALLLLPVWAVVAGIEVLSCSNLAKHSEKEFNYSILTGCYLKIDDKFVSTTFIRNID